MRQKFICLALLVQRLLKGSSDFRMPVATFDDGRILITDAGIQSQDLSVEFPGGHVEGLQNVSRTRPICGRKPIER